WFSLTPTRALTLGASAARTKRYGPAGFVEPPAVGMCRVDGRGGQGRLGGVPGPSGGVVGSGAKPSPRDRLFVRRRSSVDDGESEMHLACQPAGCCGARFGRRARSRRECQAKFTPAPGRRAAWETSRAAGCRVGGSDKHTFGADSRKYLPV